MATKVKQDTSIVRQTRNGNPTTIVAKEIRRRARPSNDTLERPRSRPPPTPNVTIPSSPYPPVLPCNDDDDEGHDCPIVARYKTHPHPTTYGWWGSPPNPMMSYSRMWNASTNFPKVRAFVRRFGEASPSRSETSRRHDVTRGTATSDRTPRCTTSSRTSTTRSNAT